MKDQKKTRHVTINLSSNQYELIKKRQESSNTPHLGQFIHFILFPKDDKIIARNLDEEKILINLNKLSIQFNQLKDQLDRDLNAAKNILTEGLKIISSGTGDHAGGD